MLMDLKAVAAELGCGRANVYSLVQKGLLAAIRVGAGGGGLRVSREELDRFIASRTQHPGENVKPFRETCKPIKLRHLR